MFSLFHPNYRTYSLSRDGRVQGNRGEQENVYHVRVNALQTIGLLSFSQHVVDPKINMHVQHYSAVYHVADAVAVLYVL